MDQGNQPEPSVTDARAEVELEIKRKELEQLDRNLRRPRWLNSAAIPIVTVLVSVGGSLLIARSAAEQRERAFAADVVRAVVSDEPLEGFRKLGLLVDAGLVHDAPAVQRAVSVLRPRAADALRRDAEAIRDSVFSTGVNRQKKLRALRQMLPLGQAAVEINPNDPDNRFLLGQVLLELGKMNNHIPYLEDAVGELEIAYEADPTDPHYGLWLGRGYIETRQTQRAREVFQSVVRRPENRDRNAYSLAEEHLRAIGGLPQ